MRPPIDIPRVIDSASRYCEARQYPAALATLNNVRQSFGDDRELVYAKACALYAWGRYWEAHRLFSRLHDNGFSRAGLSRNLGWSRLANGDPEGAEACMREAVAAAPDDWESYFGLGEALRMWDPTAAKTAFTAALDRSPENLHCLLNLCACDLAVKDATAAEVDARRALMVSRTSVAAWTNLGVALLMQDRLPDAAEAFGEGEGLSSASQDEDAEDLNRGLVLRLLGRTREAIEYYEASLPDHPSATAHGHYALALLTAGRFLQGWYQYEFRWLEEPLASQRAKYDRPAWNGQELRGKTILLRCEQGVGDVFQFIRYAPHVKNLGATVLLEVRPGLGALAETFPGVDKVFRHGEHAPSFDYYIDLMSLPRVFRTTLHSIPADVPYIHAPADIHMRLHRRLGGSGDLKVGLVWAGDPRHGRDRQRSMTLSAFALVLRIEGTRWFSLQKGPAANAARDAAFDDALVHLGPELSEYGDTAAAIENLDLVVTVDTSVAHLAGAVGKPVWVLLPFSADWRWMEDRDDSPWYPTMRLFRQRTAGDWPEVLERLRTAIVGIVRDRGNGRVLNASLFAGSHGTPDVDECSRSDDRSAVPGISRACRTRFGMIQYVPGPQALPRSLEHYGEYLQSQIDVIGHLIGPDAVVADVGAGIGLHSIALAPMVGRDGHVFSIERSRTLRRILRQNLIANEVKGVSVMPSTAAEVSLDDLQLERLDILNINDGAHAAKILDGGERTLWQHRPILLVAQESREDLDSRARQVVDLGYRCWRIDSALFNPANFNRRNDDIFHGERSLALLGMPEESDRYTAVPVGPDVTLMRF